MYIALMIDLQAFNLVLLRSAGREPELPETDEDFAEKAVSGDKRKGSSPE